MAIVPEKLREILHKAFPRAIKIEIRDLVGDNNHYHITIIDEVFQNKSRIKQHKIVNKALEYYLLNNILHAIQLTTSDK